MAPSFPEDDQGLVEGHDSCPGSPGLDLVHECPDAEMLLWAVVAAVVPAVRDPFLRFLKCYCDPIRTTTDVRSPGGGDVLLLLLAVESGDLWFYCGHAAEDIPHSPPAFASVAAAAAQTTGGQRNRSWPRRTGAAG